jgi:hypothetical protein
VALVDELGQAARELAERVDESGLVETWRDAYMTLAAMTAILGRNPSSSAQGQVAAGLFEAPDAGASMVAAALADMPLAEREQLERQAEHDVREHLPLAAARCVCAARILRLDPAEIDPIAVVIVADALRAISARAS